MHRPWFQFGAVSSSTGFSLAPPRPARVMFGYDFEEIDSLLNLNPIKDSVKVSVVRDEEWKRPIVAASLGPTASFSLPHPNPSAHTILRGALHRFGRKPPIAVKLKIALLKRFVATWLKENLTPLPAETDVSFDTWVDSTNYPEWRKNELREINQRILTHGLSKDWGRIKSFMKDEHYPDFKHARSINARSDEAKIVFGPWFRVIEKEVFQLPMFIKKVPVPDRPEVLSSLYQDGAEYVSTDYTSFEALFTAEIMDAVEFQLYEYMTQHIPLASAYMNDVRRVLGGLNVCVFKHFMLELAATRMSGEMCTSLGNGFSNWMFVSFLCGEKNIQFKGFVEGDDGIFRFNGDSLEAKDFEELGLIIKIEKHKNLEHASFCGQVFDMQDKLVVTDPREILASFGWTSGKYATATHSTKMALLRAKAWSIGYQYPGMPILASMSRAYLRLTRSYNLDKVVNGRGFLNTYERDQLLEALDSGRPELNISPPSRTRVLVAELYGVSLEAQKAYEDYFDNLQCVEPIPDFGITVPDAWYQNQLYVRDVDLNDPLVERLSWFSRRPVRWPEGVVLQSGLQLV